MVSKPRFYLPNELKESLIRLAKYMVDNNLGDRLIILYGVRVRVKDDVYIYPIMPIMYWESYNETMEPMDVSVAEKLGEELGLRIIGFAHIHNFGGSGHKFLSNIDRRTLYTLSLFDPLTLVIVLDPSSTDGVGIYWYNQETKEIESITIDDDRDTNPLIIHRDGRYEKINLT